VPRSARATWWTRFALVALLGTAWMLATPLFAGPDEPSHVVKAAATVRGELLPHRVEGTRYQFVTVPQRLDAANAAAGCVAFKPQQDASCVDYAGSGADASVPTLVGRYPPAVYAIIGLPTLVSTGVGAMYAIRLLFVLATAVCVASALADLDVLGGALARVALLVAVTPMTLFLSGTINPNAVEIAAALLVWTSALRLLAHAGDGAVASREVARCGGAALVLALARPLSPLWLACIAGVLVVGFAPGPSLRVLARSAAARVWAAVLVVACAAQTAWVLLTDPIYGDATSATDWSRSEALRNSLGRLSAQLREMIGVFGWLDTPAPELTRVVWSGALGLLLLAAFAAGARRERLALGALLAVLVVVPVVLETAQARDLGTSWQGRYSLPAAVALPLLSAVVLVRRLTLPPTFARALMASLAGALVVAHVAAYWQFLRRFTVGANGPVLFFLDARWHPPVPALVLVAGYAVVIGAFAWTALALSPARAPARPVAQSVGTSSS
jgi:hypothetical protein